MSAGSPKAKRRRQGATRISILGQKSIVIGAGLLDEAGAEAHDACKAARYAIVTDANVAKLHLPRLVASFEAAGQTPIVKVLPPGESTKCRAVQAEIEDWLLDNRFGRDACLVALGGGVIGDLTGYVAACFMRGIKVVQVPTTLLAMVDSSVGGKTGIDTPHGKNLIGAFHHPTRIIMDLEVLATLPDRQFCNGMAEVVKTALLWDAKRFEQLESHVDEVLARDTKWLREIVEGSAGIKAEVVTRDEKEGGLRTLLNVGHSVGHAVEAYLAPHMLHGEAVSIGTVKEGEIARRLGYLSQAALGRLTRCLQAYKLPVAMPQGLSVDGLMGKMAIDKKNKGGKKFISLLERIGKCVQNKAIAVEDPSIEVALARGVRVEPIHGRKLDVTLTVPGSKSISNRALLIAALGKGRCEITGLLHSDDTQVMLDALQALDACTYEWSNGGRTLVVTGRGGEMRAPPEGTEIYLGNAGTASRFLTTAVAAARATPGRSYTTLTGNKRMKERPIHDLVTALRAAGVPVTFQGREGCLPVQVKAGGLPGGSISLSSSVSSQYVSSVLISAPYAAAPVALTLTGSVVSQAYIDMTVRVMKDFGVQVQAPAEHVYKIPKAVYRNPPAYHVEADASSSTYPLAIPAVLGGTAASVTVRGIGSSSIQGDAAFAALLRRMGCGADVQSGSTTVTAPSGRPEAIDVDMEPMTDAFMTAAVVMAIAKGTSRITGVANQRVKECNRIAAMRTELGKLGVTVRELPDGLEIDGRDPSELKPARIHCYDDHRIAMSFAVLACRVPGITIDDKACVEKTYPEFWDDLQRHFGVVLRPVDDAAQDSGDAEASVVFIGMRGAGKSAVGAHCARRLDWQFVDCDERLEATAGMPVADIVKRHGWDGFREREAALLSSLLNGDCSRRCVIACGGGIVESEAGRAALAGCTRVVFLNKSLSDVEAALRQGATSRRPAWDDSLEAVYQRRLPLYRSCSRFELTIMDGDSDWKAVARDAERLVKFVVGLDAGTATCPRPATAGLGSLRTFLSLTSPKVADIVPSLPQMESGADALELRVDLLEACPDLDKVRAEVALLRRSSALPVVYTVRTKPQSGAYAGPEDRVLELLEVGRRSGCEFIDVEVTELSAQRRDTFVASCKPQARVVASLHDARGVMSFCELRDAAEEAALGGKADVVKVVGRAKSVSDCYRLRDMVASLKLPGNTKCLAILMGVEGQLSRALNDVLTPITHPALPAAAAPGQLSAAEIGTVRRLTGMIPPRSFYLFGTPIQHSKSPTIHNAGFQSLGLNHWRYHLCETDSAERVRQVMQQPDFGGGSVTIPLKLDVQALCDERSEAATRIGAVNTLTKRPDGTIHGDNTDWLGMRDCALRVSAGAPRTGICVGAGGSARAAMFALLGLGVKSPVVWNRTKAKADQLAAEFGGVSVQTLAEVREAPDVIISNVPGDAQDEFIGDARRLLHPGCVVIDMAYKPRVTQLLGAARDAGAKTVEGVDVLIEQGLYQFRHWTGMNPPRWEITNAVRTRLAFEA